ncbi:bifunctional phosphatase PAP2/diacylglycerol kinase family protein [Nocardia sp. NPDC050630]|uniref:bifunctional phosphatase PAP2/diacylglycerol kinase family protein n=1 Tax=Nocardia sp. NPDC050630 TaxID=3364321 RepID=UPI003787B91B
MRRQSRKLASHVDAWLVARSARARPSAADRFLRTLSISADHSRLWLVVAGLMALGGRAPRRAAVRGLVSVALASSVANGIAKPLFPRRRPPDESVPFVRRLVKPPVSSSFPSGHSASAAAFATGVAIESPAAAAIVAPIALAVGYSRVHIGVHWPSDVIAGGALGGAIALGTRRWWAQRDDEPAELGAHERITPMRDGFGLLLVINPGAGAGTGSEQLRLLHESLPAAEILTVADDLTTQIAKRVGRDEIAALGVFGGDGTVSAVAAAAVEHRLPLAVFAGGTLNHFARDTGVECLDDTLAALESGEAVRTDTAEVRSDGLEPRTFVNTASLGGYPDFVRFREHWQPRLGKWPAAGIAMLRVLFRAQPLPTTIDGTRTAIWMLFVGNGHYRPAHQIPMSRPALRHGTLDIRYLRADLPFSRIRLIWATLTGTLDRSATYVNHHADRLSVHIDDGPVALATDGEVDYRGDDFTFTSRPATLTLVRREEPN